jgi:hypothetical protein
MNKLLKNGENYVQNELIKNEFNASCRKQFSNIINMIHKR